MHSWADAGKPARLLEKAARKDDPEPKALSCYGLYLPELKESWLRFVDGRPVSSITTRFLCWCCHRLKARGKKALLLIWDNASWHKSREVRNWISAHNRCVKASGHGVRIVPSLLPTKSPWLNAIEPIWIHGKRKVVEPERLLGAYELAERVCKVFGCTHEEHLAIPQEVAPGQSGASLGRPGMDRVRDLVAAGGVSVVLAQDRDRFAQSRHTITCSAGSSRSTGRRLGP